ncbi:hypothetical protein PHAVU_002G313300 [Phaseolus vulgaris]|uniref:Serine hydroxymethyltransferase-like domain-containing protein n=1 Tax=Phaseolus vulgaris TaxID=3885 RepID=V7CQ54_PHAVU|nr:hypothetical protein PHAVU_002G313300g [Phaseolus vulgaris]ESW32332.1 hypothetical protein PHAVU_002G313300g [Phaseolus vulgaris]
MQASAMMGSLQQPVWNKEVIFPAKGYGNNNGFVPQLKFFNVKPCKASHVEGGLVTGSTLSLSFAVPQIGVVFKKDTLFVGEHQLPRAVMEAVGSCLTNKYSEGLPGKRYYGGNEYIDELETLRALAAFGVDGNKWGVNVQPLSGSPANIADGIGVFLMMDMAHISGFVAASVLANPFEYCDIVTTTTHKVLRGGMIFFKKDCVHGVDLESAINNAVFPGLQGIDGARVEKILDMASITLNKNSVPGDKSALVLGGIRIGAPAMTTRGLGEKEFAQIADLIHEGVQISLKAKSLVSGTKLQDLLKFVLSPEFPLGDKVSGFR